jgi:hypothetical protein
MDDNWRWRAFLAMRLGNSCLRCCPASFGSLLADTLPTPAPLCRSLLPPAHLRIFCLPEHQLVPNRHWSEPSQQCTALFAAWLGGWMQWLGGSGHQAAAPLSSGMNVAC